MEFIKLQFFSGTYAELQDEVSLTGIRGEWRDSGDHKNFRADSGAILDWEQSTATITFQGPELAAAEFEAKLFLRVMSDELDGLEIIPSELLSGITAGKIDWERGSLIDDEGRLWIDLLLSSDAVEATIDGDKVPILVCGRRARH